LLLPLLPFFLLEHEVNNYEEVDGKEGDAGETNTTAEDIDAASGNAATDYATMLPKVMPPPKKLTRWESTAAAMPPPPVTAAAVAIATTFSVDVEDPSQRPTMPMKSTTRGGTDKPTTSNFWFLRDILTINRLHGKVLE